MQVSNHDIVLKNMPADVANAGTFQLVLPAGKTSGLYNGVDHRMSVPAFGGEEYSSLSGKMGVTFTSPSIITITNNTGRTIPKDALVYLQLDRLGMSGEVVQTLPDRVRLPTLAAIDIGTPVASSPNGIATSQSVLTSSAGMVLTATKLDVPRALVGAWTTAAVCTVRGKDEFGQSVTEASASGVAFTGKKAFASIDSIKFSANVTAATFGWSNTLGLPLFLSDKGNVQRVIAGGVAYEDHANDFTVGVTAAPTGISGDVRGTVLFTSPLVPNGVLAHTILILPEDLHFRGRPQYAG